MPITERNVMAWKPPHGWSNPRNSWRDAPRTYRALLMVGRTSSCQPWVDETVLEEMEERYPNYAKRPFHGDLSISQRLDMVATGMLARSMEGVVSHAAKSDILTSSKALMRSRRELPFPDMDVWSGFDHILDRRGLERVEKWWGTGVSALEEPPPDPSRRSHHRRVWA